MFPERSVARTRKACRPRASFRYVFGEEHLRHTRLSSLQCRTDHRSVARNLNVTARLVVLGAGPAVIRVLGGVVSGGVSSADRAAARIGRHPSGSPGTPRSSHAATTGPLGLAST